MKQKDWVLNCFNETLRKGEKPITLENAKGMYIPKERVYLEKHFGKEVVTEIFGQASNLEKAESRLLEIENGEVSKETKYEYLIDIVNRISSTCAEKVDSNTAVWDKYATLHEGIPIHVIKYVEGTSPLYYGWYKKEEKVTADELAKAKIWLSQPAAKVDLEKKAYFEYIFELVYISLGEILQEVKQKIMGK